MGWMFNATLRMMMMMIMMVTTIIIIIIIIIITHLLHSFLFFLIPVFSFYLDEVC